MKKFQIQFTDKDGSGSFKYFDTDKDDYKEKAVEVANEYHEKSINGQGLFRHYEPIKIINVVEYDSETGKASRGGIKFKLKLSYVQITFQSGDKRKDTFYIVKE